MDEKPVRKPRNILINLEVLHRARVEALRSSLRSRLKGKKRGLDEKKTCEGRSFSV